MTAPIIFMVYAVAFIAISLYIKKGIRSMGETTQKNYRSNFSNLNVRRTVSSDGHVVPKKDDFTCEGKEGHYHEPQSEEFGQRYIVHEEPENGYVVLNGKMIRLEDCKDL